MDSSRAFTVLVLWFGHVDFGMHRLGDRHPQNSLKHTRIRMIGAYVRRIMKKTYICNSNLTHWLCQVKLHFLIFKLLNLVKMTLNFWPPFVSPRFKKREFLYLNLKFLHTQQYLFGKSSCIQANSAKLLFYYYKKL